MTQPIDIHKAAGILIQDKKLLVTRTRGKQFFIAPGGRVERGETVTEALVRELSEELGIQVSESDIAEFGTFSAPAVGAENKQLQMDVFLVEKWNGDIQPAAEVEEIKWIDSHDVETITLGSIFKHDVFPRLVEQRLIH